MEIRVQNKTQGSFQKAFDRFIHFQLKTEDERTEKLVDRKYKKRKKPEKIYRNSKKIRIF